MRAVNYDQQTINAPNPIVRLAHRNRVNTCLGIVNRHLPRGGKVVDFGAGEGYFLSRLAQDRPDARLFAIEPFMPPQANAPFTYLTSMDEVEDASADVVVAMDVCEHLYEADLVSFVADAARIVKSDGRLMVSVPIMLGATVALKELNRAVLFRRKTEYSIGEIIKATFGGSVPRPDNPYWTHKGLDWRWVRGHLERYFDFEKISSGPLPAPWWTNSEIYFVCKKR